MTGAGTRFAVRLAPIVFVLTAVGLWFADVHGNSGYVVINTLPLFVLFALSAFTLWRGDGRWTGSGYRMPLGTLGFAVPTLGLAVYLHYAYAVNLNGMFDAATDPLRLFLYLPAYTLVAGAIGFAIGTIVGRNL